MSETSAGSGRVDPDAPEDEGELSERDLDDVIGGIAVGWLIDDE